MSVSHDGFIARPPKADPFESLILVVGAPRSGTTWLAKILDSHPDTIYRHEPDEIIQPPSTVDESNILPLLRAWALDRSLRTTSKRPFFRKSWQDPARRLIRTALAYGLLAMGRLPGAGPHLRSMTLADMGNTMLDRPLIKSVRWCEGVGSVARLLPGSRAIVILRNPCGQVHSVMRGARQNRFELREEGDMPLDQVRATACAASYGIDAAAFHALPDAAKYAWGWIGFNETLEKSVAGLPNVLTILYEDLCARPEAVAREILAFTGLSWNQQTANFVARSSSHAGDSGYYDVFQNAVQAASRWRSELSPADQAAIRTALAHSTLARHWPDP